MAGCHCTKDRDLTGHAAIATHLKDRIMIFFSLTHDTNFESSNFELELRTVSQNLNLKAPHSRRAYQYDDPWQLA